MAISTQNLQPIFEYRVGHFGTRDSNFSGKTRIPGSRAQPYRALPARCLCTQILFWVMKKESPLLKACLTYIVLGDY